MTELQQVEFEMLKRVVAICDELHIKYFLVCGSVLGAIKYQGFIPWDDDIDVGLMRNDYEIFIKNAPALLPPHFFLQNAISDPQYPMIFSKLRNSETTYIEKSVATLSINHGAYIDIFPLDGYPKTRGAQLSLEGKKKIYSYQTSTAFQVPRKICTRILNCCLRFLGYHKRINKVVARYNKMIAKYPVTSAEIICNHGNWQGKLEYAPQWHYGNGTWATFEGLKVRIPENYDAYLTQKYGDWRADLLEDQKVGHHYYEVCDLTRPYTDYIENLPNGKIRIKAPDELNRKK